ncbi:MAG: hypothetical protein JST19_13740 [Bacteroidetes bacterium]|nr:hypothetical protein [Bacteroidota bacterium]
MDAKKLSRAEQKKAEIEKILQLLKDEIGIREISASGLTYLNKLSRKDRLKTIAILELQTPQSIEITQEIDNILYILKLFDLPQIDRCAVAGLSPDERSELNKGLSIAFRLANQAACGDDLEIYKLN